MHAVGAQGALWRDVGCAPVVKLRERVTRQVHLASRRVRVGQKEWGEASPSHRKVAPSAVQPGDAVVALDLLLALGAFALKGGKYLSEIMPA